LLCLRWNRRPDPARTENLCSWQGVIAPLGASLGTARDHAHVVAEEREMLGGAADSASACVVDWRKEEGDKKDLHRTTLGA
jgi:hypothetical protein